MANSTDLADRELLRVRKLKQTMTTTPTKTSQMGRLNQARLKSSQNLQLLLPKTNGNNVKWPSSAYLENVGHDGKFFPISF